MAYPKGIFQSFAQGLMLPGQFMSGVQQYKRGKVSQEQAKEDLLKSQIANKYYDRKMLQEQEKRDALAVQRLDAHQLATATLPYAGPKAKENLLKLQIANKYYNRNVLQEKEARDNIARAADDAHQLASARAPYIGQKAAAELRELHIKNELAPRNMSLKEKNALTREKRASSRGRRETRLSKPGVQLMKVFSSLTTEAKRQALMSPMGPIISKYMSAAAKATQKNVQTGRAIWQPRGHELPGTGPEGTATQSQPSLAPAQLPPPGANYAPSEAPLSGGTQVPSQVPQDLPGFPLPVQQVPVSPVPKKFDTGVQMQRASRDSANKSAVSAQLWNRASSARVNEAVWRDPKIRKMMSLAAKYAGVKGGIKKWKDRISTKGSPEYNAYLQLTKIARTHIANQTRQMEGLSVQSEQRKELQDSLTGWTGILNVLAMGPKEVLDFMNESGRESNLLARSLQKESTPYGINEGDEIKEWEDIKLEDTFSSRVNKLAGKHSMAELEKMLKGAK